MDLSSDTSSLVVRLGRARLSTQQLGPSYLMYNYLPGQLGEGHNPEVAGGGT